jgi:NAD-dependent dihydropyrimidine dehydrogenase PreA subunit
LSFASANEPEGNRMPYIIVEPCINLKDRSCVDVCPVDCIYEGEDQLYIHPDECIDCGACEPECPVTAIFPEEDVPEQWKSFIAKNRDVFQSANPPGKPQRKGA